MKFTIGTVSNFQKYDEELKLIKSSLLYADEIELIGLTEYAAFCYLPAIFDNNKNLIELIDGMLPFIRSVNLPNKDDFINQLEYAKNQLQNISPVLKKKSYRTKAEFQTQMKMKKMESDLKELIATTSEKLVDHPTAKELQNLIERKIVKIFDYNVQSFNTEELAGSYVGNMLNAIYSTRNYPLFDNTSTEFINGMSKI